MTDRIAELEAEIRRATASGPNSGEGPSGMSSEMIADWDLFSGWVTSIEGGQLVNLQGRPLQKAGSSEQLIYEIAAIVDASPEEVKEFYEAHSYSLELIKKITLAGAKLDEDSMRGALMNTLLPAKFAELDAIKSCFEEWRNYL